jgi:hypothetical protein
MKKVNKLKIKYFQGIFKVFKVNILKMKTNNLNIRRYHLMYSIPMINNILIAIIKSNNRMNIKK